VGQDQRRAVGGLDDLGHGEGLARAGHAQQHLVPLARREAAEQFVNRPRLISLRLVAGDELEVHFGIVSQDGEDWANMRSFLIFSLLGEPLVYYPVLG
jgi:hypothetical protein